MSSYNLKGILDNIYDQMNWSPGQSQAARDTLVRMVNRAYLKIAENTPYLFLEETQRFTIYPTYLPDAADTLLWRSPYILRRKLSVTDSGDWKEGNFWTGRTVQIITPSGLRLESKIRSIVRVTESGVSYEHITLLNSIDIWGSDDQQDGTRLTDELPYVIYDKDKPLSKDLIKANNFIFSQNNNVFEARLIDQLQADYYNFRTLTDNSTAQIPFVVFRGGGMNVPPPTIAPSLVLDAGDTWDDPEPGGKFEYCYTYGFGYKDPESNADINMRVAGGIDSTTVYAVTNLIESSPSPTQQITAVHGGNAVKITVPNIWYELGYLAPGSADGFNYAAGLYVNIYRRRMTVGNYGANSPTYIGTSNHFELVQQIGFDAPPLTNSTFDTGRLPGKQYRLRHNPSNELLGIFPPPTTKFVLEVRGIFTPEPLLDDSDIPKLKPGAINLFVLATCALLYERANNVRAQQLKNAEFNDALATYHKLHSLPKPDSMIFMREVNPSFSGVKHATKVWWRD